MNNTRVSAATVIRSSAPNAQLQHSRPGVGNDTVLSKMIRDQSGTAPERHDSPYLGNFGYLQESADIMATNIDDYQNQAAMLPEIEICIQVLQSLILSPKDITQTELKHEVTPNVLPPEMAQAMVKILADYAEHDYKIKALLPGKLRKALFMEGADVTIIIPENSLDDLINGRGKTKISLESFKAKGVYDDISKPLGYMSDGEQKNYGTMTLENMLSSLASSPVATKSLKNMQLVGESIASPHIAKWDFTKFKNFAAPAIYDNPQMMKLGEITDSIKAAQNGVALESVGGGYFGSLDSIYHSPDVNPEDFVTILRQEDASRPTEGPPLIKVGPTESCMPVVRPSNPKQPIGFLFMLDEFGAMVSRASRSDYFRNISAGVFNNRNAMSGMLGQMASQLDMDDGFTQQTMTIQAMQAFRELALRDIESRFSNGTVGNVTVSRMELAFDLMFERALANKQTRIVYVPADMVVYWAYNWNDNGTGRSLMEDNKILSSIRALTMFMNIETHLRNSIDHRTLNITIDEDDPNKVRTKEMILHEYARQRACAVPWATSNPRRMVEIAQQSGLAINVEGGDSFPGTKVSVDSRPVEYREVNLELDEDLRKRQTMGFGLAPEIVDLSTQIEFSSKMATSNELSLKRAILLQDRTNALIRETLIKIAINHKGIMDKLRKAVAEHSKDIPKEKLAKLGEDFFIKTFFQIYKVSLPRPDTGLANRMTELDEYISAVEKVLDHVMPDDLLQGAVTGESTNEWVGVVKASVKSQLVLAYCRNNNIMPEVTDLLKNDTVEDPGTKLIESGIEDVGRLVKIIQGVGLQLYSKALITENQMATLKERLDTQRVEGTDAVEGSSTGGGDSDFDSDSGDDEFDFGDDDTDGDGGDFDFGDEDTGDDLDSDTEDDTGNDNSTEDENI